MSAPGEPLERVAIVIGARLEELPRVAQAVDELGARHGVPADALADVNVSLDEVLSNAIRYGGADVREIRVAVAVYPQALRAEIEDDGRPFDPLAALPPDLVSSPRGTQVGGLGIHFVRSLMSEVQYERRGAQNRLVLTRLFR